MIGLMLIFNNLIDNHILNIVMVLIAYDIVKQISFALEKELLKFWRNSDFKGYLVKVKETDKQ